MENKKSIADKYLYLIWTIIITSGLVFAVISVQNNSNADQARMNDIDSAQTLSFCHAVADSKQAGKDVLLTFAVQTAMTDKMTPGQKEATEALNRRRLAYGDLANVIYVAPTCSDGYVATSNSKAAIAILNAVETGNAPTTTTTTPGGH